MKLLSVPVPAGMLATPSQEAYTGLSGAELRLTAPQRHSQTNNPAAAVQEGSCYATPLSSQPGGARPRSRLQRLPFASLSSLFDRVVGDEENKVDPWERASHSMRRHTIAGDGRCMFRATARGLARQRGKWLAKSEELQEAELLQRACYDALCVNKRKKMYNDAWQQIEFGYDGIAPYCKNLKKPAFWGGEVEMMVLAKMLRVPFYVYKPAEESGGQKGDYNLLIKFGEEYGKANRKDAKPRAPVRLLYTGGNHYDLLLD